MVLIKYQFSASDSLEEILDDQELNLVILRGFDYWVLLGFGFSEVGF